MKSESHADTGQEVSGRSEWKKMTTKRWRLTSCGNASE